MSQRPARAPPGGATSARPDGARPGATVLQGEDEDVRARVGRGLHAQGQGNIRAPRRLNPLLQYLYPA